MSIVIRHVTNTIKEKKSKKLARTTWGCSKEILKAKYKAIERTIRSYAALI